MLPHQRSIQYGSSSINQQPPLPSYQSPTTHSRSLSTSPEPTPSPPHPTPLRLICTCTTTPPANATYTQCQNCGHLQHAACALHDANEEDEEALEGRCNNCKLSWLNRRIHLQRQRVAALFRIVQRKRNIVRIFYHEMLWKQYCSLPLHDAGPRGLARLQRQTEMRYDVERGNMPLFPAPQSWVDEMQRRVWRMMTDAGKEVSSRFMEERSAWEMVDLRILVDWQNLAMWMLHHGPYRGRRTERLGVLAELLGFEEKGAFWKGDGV